MITRSRGLFLPVFRQSPGHDDVDALGITSEDDESNLDRDEVIPPKGHSDTGVEDVHFHLRLNAIDMDSAEIETHPDERPLPATILANNLVNPTDYFTKAEAIASASENIKSNNSEKSK